MEIEYATGPHLLSRPGATDRLVGGVASLCELVCTLVSHGGSPSSGRDRESASSVDHSPVASRIACGPQMEGVLFPVLHISEGVRWESDQDFVASPDGAPLVRLRFFADYIRKVPSPSPCS